MADLIEKSQEENVEKTQEEDADFSHLVSFLDDKFQKELDKDQIDGNGYKDSDDSNREEDIDTLRSNPESGPMPDKSEPLPEIKELAIDKNATDGTAYPIPKEIFKHEERFKYYKILYRNQPPNKEPPLEVKIWLDSTKAFKNTWNSSIQNAMIQINTAAPGLHLEFGKDPNVWDIYIHPPKIEEGSWTIGNILNKKQSLKTKIQLESHPGPEQRKNGTALHEIMHALGFEHEHQRKDSPFYIKHGSDMTDEEKDQLASLPNILPLTPYDYYSVMHYPVCKGLKLKYIYSDKTPPRGETPPKEYSENFVLSELDKVGLNFCFRPCISATYTPKQHDNGMYYCNRAVMSRHNHPGQHDGLESCMKNSPNCPACRVLSKPSNMKHNQWQGWSGCVYCSNEGCGGPHQGIPCDKCKEVIFKT